MANPNPEDKIVASGFGDNNANGDYNWVTTFNGQNFYRKDANYFLAYYPQYRNYSLTASYYIMKQQEIGTTGDGSTVIYVPLYQLTGTSPVGTAAQWRSLRSLVSGEATTGTTVQDLGSSSSSSSSSSSTSSSSSSIGESSSSSVQYSSSSSSSSSEQYSSSSSSSSYGYSSSSSSSYGYSSSSYG